MDDDETRAGREDQPDPGAAPTLGNAVYRWANATLKPLPFPLRAAVVGILIAFLVFLPLVLFLQLIGGT